MSQLFPIPPTDMVRVKHMSREDADTWLTTYHPNISPDDKSRLLGMAQGDRRAAEPSNLSDATIKEHVSKIRTERQRFTAAAWRLGASMNQLAALLDISRQSVQQSVNRCTPKHTRDKIGQLRDNLKFEQLAYCHNTWLNNHELRSLEYYPLAERFHELLNLQGDD